MERAQSLGLRSGTGGNGVIPFFLSFFPFCHSHICYLSVGMKESGGGAPPSSQLAQRRRGYQGPVIP